MLTALGRRGPDSAGVALYGDHGDSMLVVRVKLGEQGRGETRGSAGKERVQDFCSVIEHVGPGRVPASGRGLPGGSDCLERAIEQREKTSKW